MSRNFVANMDNFRKEKLMKVMPKKEDWYDNNILPVKISTNVFTSSPTLSPPTKLECSSLARLFKA